MERKENRDGVVRKKRKRVAMVEKVRPCRVINAPTNIQALFLTLGQPGYGFMQGGREATNKSYFDDETIGFANATTGDGNW